MTKRRLAYGKIAATATLITTGIVLIATIGVTPPDTRTGAAKPVPGAATPAPAAPAPHDRPHASDAAQLTAWSQRLAARTGIPARAVSAYGRTEMWLRSEAPECRLSWATVAGVADAAATRPRGRAVGPLRIMPRRWARWRIRAMRDGEVPDPHDIDDAALTAGRILCGTGADLSAPDGWWRAVRAYPGTPNGAGFAQNVFTSAERYAELSR